jgi:hypothetical protein
MIPRYLFSMSGYESLKNSLISCSAAALSSRLIRGSNLRTVDSRQQSRKSVSVVRVPKTTIRSKNGTSYLCRLKVQSGRSQVLVQIAKLPTGKVSRSAPPVNSPRRHDVVVPSGLNLVDQIHRRPMKLLLLLLEGGGYAQTQKTRRDPHAQGQHNHCHNSPRIIKATTKRYNG